MDDRKWIKHGWLVDPPNGWRYGFPKPVRGALKYEDLKWWLVKEGYPKEMAEEFWEYTTVTMN
jgi:hypothetical protein